VACVDEWGHERPHDANAETRRSSLTDASGLSEHEGSGNEAETPQDPMILPISLLDKGFRAPIRGGQLV